MKTNLNTALIISAFLASICCFGTVSARCEDDCSIYSCEAKPTLSEEQGEEVENYFSPADLLIDRDGKNFYVASEGFAQLRRVPNDGRSPAEILALTFQPFKTRFFPDETRIAVVGGVPNGRCAIVRIADENGPCAMRVDAEFPAGHSPSDVVAAKVGTEERLYVADRFNGRVLELDVSDGTVLRTWDVGREPFAMELTPDGKRLVVADRITDMIANQSMSFAKVFAIELSSGNIVTIDTLNGIGNLQDVAIEPSGRYAFVTAVQTQYMVTTGQVIGGWVAENCVVAIDLEKNKLVEIFFLDDSDLAAANPWGVTISEDSERLVVSCSGTDEIIYLPLKRVFEMLSRRPENARPGYGAFAYNSNEDTINDVPMRIRVKFGLKGMRQIVARGEDVYALAYFEDAICKTTLRLTPPFKYEHEGATIEEVPPRTRSSIAAANGALPEDDSQNEAESYVDDAVLRFTKLADCEPSQGVQVERSFARLAPKPKLTTRRKGEIVFHDGTECADHWLSCATCHPDARADGFNWDLVNDGTGNFKNTKSMLLSHETPPSMISGIRKDAETAVRAGFTHILFRTVDEAKACCVDDYLSSLKPVPSPRLVEGKLSESAKRGKRLFESERIDCVRCHLGDYFTDMRLHRIGSQDVNDTIEKFDTPTLIEVWRTAPYMNTGAYVTLRQLFEEGKHGVKDGRFERLTKQEQDDLIEYVLSL